MAHYYFAGASLPLLVYDAKTVPLSVEAFTSVVTASLSPADSRKVLSLDLSALQVPGALSPVGRSFWQAEKNLRNELVRLRTAALHSDPKNDWVQPENDPYVVEAAAAAFKEPSPYQAELILDAWRWRQIDELETGHFYDVDFFTAYFIKLQLLIRKNRFSREKGNEQFTQIYQSVLDGCSHQMGEMQ